MSNSYLENNAKIRIGQNTYEIDQLFSSQASIHYQELLFNLAFNAPERQLSYKVDFEHRLGGHENVNRLEINVPTWIELEAFLKHQKNKSGQKLETGLSYFQKQLAGGLEVKHEDTTGAIKGKSYVRWGPVDDSNANVIAEFELRKKTPSPMNYEINTVLRLPYTSPVEASGTILLGQESIQFSFVGQHDETLVGADFNLAKVGSEIKVEGKLRTSTIEYSIDVTAQNDDTKSIHAVLILDKKYELEVKAVQHFRDLTFDFTYGPSSNEKIVLKGQLLPSKVKAEFSILGNNGWMSVEHDADKVTILTTYNEDNVQILAEKQINRPGDFELRLVWGSTIPSFERAVVDLKHTWISNSNEIHLDSGVSIFYFLLLNKAKTITR